MRFWYLVTSTWAGIHRRDQLEVCRESERTFGAADGDDFILHRLAHHFEDACTEFGEFIQEQNTKKFPRAWEYSRRRPILRAKSCGVAHGMDSDGSMVYSQGVDLQRSKFELQPVILRCSSRAKCWASRGRATFCRLQENRREVCYGRKTIHFSVVISPLGYTPRARRCMAFGYPHKIRMGRDGPN
jgi:hypothetical protein